MPYNVGKTAQNRYKKGRRTAKRHHRIEDMHLTIFFSVWRGRWTKKRGVWSTRPPPLPSDPQLYSNNARMRLEKSSSPQTLLLRLFWNDSSKTSFPMWQCSFTSCFVQTRDTGGGPAGVRGQQSFEWFEHRWKVTIEHRGAVSTEELAR